MPYPAAPGERMAYDRDGSIMVGWGPGTGVATLSAANLTAANREGGGGAGVYFSTTGGEAYFVIIFPELRDVVGIIWGAIGAYNNGPMESALDFYTSTNTTTGQDGTWTSQSFPSPGVNLGNGGTTAPTYRSSISTVSWLGINAIRMHGPNGGQPYGLPFTLYYWQLYGKPSSGQNLNSLRCWQPVTNAELTGPLDFGDIAHGSNATLSFRIANVSSTLTANGPITVSMETLWDASPTLLSQWQLSSNGINFASSLSLTSLAPGAISSVLYVRDTVASGAALGPWDARIVAVPSSWS